MKKIIFVLCLAFTTISISSFRIDKAKRKFTSYYWFYSVSGFGQTCGSPVDAASTIYLGYGSIPPSSSCDNGTTYYCIMGFAAEQVYQSGENYGLIDDNQTPISTPYTRSSP